MGRRIFNVIFALSLLLCMATAVLWIVGIRRSDAFYFGRRSGIVWEVDSGGGWLRLWRFRKWSQPPEFHHEGGLSPVSYSAYSKLTGPVMIENGFGGARSRNWTWWQLYGDTGSLCFVTKPDGTIEWDAPIVARMDSLSSNHYSPPMPFWDFMAPDWLIVVLFGILPAIASAAVLIKKAAAHWRRPKGHCPVCGYDLRATPDRCPECGTVPATKRAT